MSRKLLISNMVNTNFVVTNLREFKNPIPLAKTLIYYPPAHFIVRKIYAQRVMQNKLLPGFVETGISDKELERSIIKSLFHICTLRITTVICHMIIWLVASGTFLKYTCPVNCYLCCVHYLCHFRS